MKKYEKIYQPHDIIPQLKSLQKKINNLEINKDLILFLHHMLITAINDNIAGKFRRKGEFVRVGTHTTPAPDLVEKMIDDLIKNYIYKEDYILNKIIKLLGSLTYCII